MPPKKIPKRAQPRCVVTHCDQPVFRSLECCKKNICAGCFVNIMEYYGEVDSLALRCPNCRRLHELHDNEIIDAFAANDISEKTLNDGNTFVFIEPCPNRCTRCPNATVWVDPVTENMDHEYVFSLREDGTPYNQIPDRLCLRWLLST